MKARSETRMLFADERLLTNVERCCEGDNVLAHTVPSTWTATLSQEQVFRPTNSNSRPGKAMCLAHAAERGAILDNRKMSCSSTRAHSSNLEDKVVLDEVGNVRAQNIRMPKRDAQKPSCIKDYVED